MLVHLHDLLNGGGLHEGGSDALLDREHNALGGHHADGRRAELDGLDRIFDLQGRTKLLIVRGASVARARPFGNIKAGSYVPFTYFWARQPQYHSTSKKNVY